ncbi:hypothetical protein Y1Q_0012280 [Alligator mississippiensis]|uniref:Uncharacterized protein n=1 Tax=Alligator mississippiensis TaxID=8496 RepID=A0A151MLE7_ALLMI|nr:hypothetical protein Y1Q_0012280 [Alligator mississippiensis]
MAGRGTALAALVADAHRPLLFLLADFSYGADEYDAEGNEEPKAPPEGSETMPYIDESPTMSPQLSARSQESGDGISPTPADGLGTGRLGLPWVSSALGLCSVAGAGGNAGAPRMAPFIRLRLGARAEPGPAGLLA